MDLSRLQSLAGITTQSPIITEELNYWQLMAGLTPELLQEAREDQIAKSQGHKLISAYQQKEQNPTISDPLELLQFISRNTIPEYIQWIATQYIKDPNFTLKDLSKLKEILVLYKPLFNRKKIQDLSKFNIKSLEQAVSELSGGDLSVSYNPEMLRFYEAMLTSEKLGNGVFKYKSGNLCVYTPTNVEGARELRRANLDTVHLCTTFLDKSSFYDNYASNGIQDYVLVPDNMYLCYIGITGKKPNEFADYKNIRIGIEKLLKIPRLKQILTPDIIKSNDIQFIFSVGLIHLIPTGKEYVTDNTGDRYFINPGNGPSVIKADGTKEWWKNGELHRVDGPAIERPDGTKKWYLNGRPHRVDGPAVERPDGTKKWYLNGRPHRENGPSVIKADGTKEWWKNGELHREDGPAIETTDGATAWYLNGDLHRENGPAIEEPDGYKEWYLNGEQHREDGPAVEYPNGYKEWYLNGDRHREDGPAVVRPNGHKEWWLNGKWHRVDGPAIVRPDGHKEWRKNGQLHREDGPAVTWPDGGNRWFLNNQEYTQEEFNDAINKY